MEKQTVQKLTLITILIIVFWGFTVPTLAEKVIIRGDYVKYSVSNDFLLVEGNAELISEDVKIYSDQMRATYRDGQVIDLKATGHVELNKNGDTFHADEFTYFIKEKTGLIIEINGTASIEDSEEKAYLSGRRANYSEKFIEIFDSDLTSCDLEHPHYLFKAKRVEFYPDDKIKAWHLTFWEFNGKIPLFYWPYYVISLKDEERDFTPELGYSPVTGLFLKTIYRYYLWNHRGELYMDYFQKTGPAVGFKQYYMDDDKNVGYVYAYLQKQDKNKTIPYLVAKHSQRAVWGGLTFNSNTSFNRYGNRDTLSSANSLAYFKNGNSLRWDGTFTGGYTPIANSNTLKNTLRGKWKFSGITFDGYFTNDNYFHRPTSNYWQGYLKVNQYKSLYDWNLQIQKKGNANKKQEFYYLPELTFNLKPSGLNRKNPLRTYLAPFSYNTQLGYYIENRTEVEAVRWYNKLNFKKEIAVLKPLRLVLSTDGQLRLYSTQDWVYMYSPGVELKTVSFHGFTSSIKYSYSKGEGETPFLFDRISALETQQVSGSMSYRLSGLSITSSTSYNLKTNKFNMMSNSATYIWGAKRHNQIYLSVPYDLERKKFGIMTGKATMREDDLTLSFESQLNPDGWKVTKLNSNLDWKINDDWHIQIDTAFNPTKGFNLNDPQTKGAFKIIRDLHCREISLSYDAVKKEVWLQYQITAFPKQKVRLGSSEDDRFQFDFDLGGIMHAQ